MQFPDSEYYVEREACVDEDLIKRIKKLEIGKHIHIPYPKNIIGKARGEVDQEVCDFLDDMYALGLEPAVLGVDAIFRKFGPPMIVLNTPDIDVALKNEVEEMLNRNTKQCNEIEVAIFGTPRMDDEETARYRSLVTERNKANKKYLEVRQRWFGDLSVGVMGQLIAETCAKMNAHDSMDSPVFKVGEQNATP